MQKTLAKKVSFVGVGLHTGKPTWVTVKPAPADHGVIFRLTHGESIREIPATLDLVVNTRRCTSIGTQHATLNTVEHILAALAGLGVDNAVIDLDGPEIPILDGSSRGFVEFIQAAGLRVQQSECHRLKVLRPFTCQLDRSRIEILPYDGFAISCTIDFDHPGLGEQRFEYIEGVTDFVSEIAPARTFGFVSEVDQLREAGLIRGASLDNAVVYGPQGCINPDGLRFEDECVRHKILDIIGDFSLLGARVVGHIVAHCPGHSINNRFLKELLRHETAYCWVEGSRDQRVAYRDRRKRELKK